MGVTRAVNEDLRSEHRIFIVEMDAYAPGEIASICRLVRPTVAIVTAVGPQHLERFRSMNRIADALFLAPSLAPDRCEQIAASLGLSPPAFRACAADPATEERLDADVAWVRAASPGGLPVVSRSICLIMGMCDEPPTSTTRSTWSQRRPASSTAISSVSLVVLTRWAVMASNAARVISRNLSLLKLASLTPTKFGRRSIRRAISSPVISTPAR